jgi:hypothetical protein
MHRFVLPAALVLALSAPAMAAEPLYDLIAQDGAVATFVDLNSRVVNKPTVQFQALGVNLGGALAESYPTAHYIVGKHLIDCDAKTAQTLGLVIYGKSDEVLLSVDSASKVVQINPNSYYDTEYRYLCQGVRPHPEFKMLAVLKDAVAFADSAAKPASDKH